MRRAEDTFTPVKKAYWKPEISQQLRALAVSQRTGLCPQHSELSVTRVLDSLNTVYRHTCKQNPTHIKNVYTMSKVLVPTKMCKNVDTESPFETLIFKALFYFSPNLLFSNHPPNRCIQMLLPCVLSGLLLSTYLNNPGSHHCFHREV